MSEAPEAKTVLSIGEFAEIALQGRSARDVAQALLIAAAVRLIQVHGSEGAASMLRFTARQCGNPAMLVLAQSTPSRAEAH